ncbi:NAD(+) kinase [Cyanobacterium aponinum UTEX 3222]|uniref:NAD kinase n=3 Tax=Cyanobacterium aponinum TaxID=379064 RepID=K9Z0T1_CYAAP|nr:NAD(+) kinase [Cyanobacterium aponinum]MBD2392888.1 NAD(+) kinase [Cyanobacterium aponinum FACHB-4101]MTF37928.1 NAD(+) kinase [Cyanobacterium aponinum 0216]WRL40693.1 NAD(+) kinase [Cyanobacterium aponinum UTEX 3222]AFZ52764.1 inorganic polyphosphate/ATP-NAD kinase [Cyanobacterium aponinum PCC 10605]PHV62315.1 NAD(+) kinase [Cyanobacterium aponinum IPPAS B-1201]
MRLKQVIIAYKAEDKESKKWAERCAKELEARQCKVLLGPSGVKDNPYPVFLASTGQKIDLGIILGGDGTVLAAARHLSPESIPLLAVNVGGHLGFLTEPFELFKDTEKLWHRLENDLYAVERRMMLEAQVWEREKDNCEPVSDRFFCLNEMCVKPACLDRMPTSLLEMEVDGEVVDQYHGDGLIVSTPTGSTCYTASANGPIMHPGMSAIAVTPICPLSLSSRSLILPPRSVVSIWSLGDYELNNKLWTDGALATTMWPGQWVNVKMADCNAQFIILRDSHSFYKTLRDKLQWAGARIYYQNNHRN